MIKLKDIVYEVYEELREASRGSGEREFTIEIDGQFIPALSLPEHTIYINVSLLYDYDPGSPERGMFGAPEHAEQGEGPTIEITGHDILDIKTVSDKGGEREVNYNMLHPQQKKAIDNLVDAYIHENEETITQKILDGYDE